jgi:carboxypeptidase PM20D1
MDFDKRLVLANLWLFEPLVVRDLSVQPGTDALMRTTVAPTMLSGSVKDNVLPSQARAVVNFRLHPRDDAEAVIEHVRRAIADPRDPAIRRLRNPRIPRTTPTALRWCWNSAGSGSSTAAT